LKSLSEPLQFSFRFFEPPLPVGLSALALRLAFPFRGTLRAYHVPYNSTVGLGAYFNAERFSIRRRYSALLCLPRGLLATACKPLPLFIRSRILCRFTYVHLTDSLALTRFVVIRKIRLSRFVSHALIALCYVVRSASLFRILGSPGDTGGYIKNIFYNKSYTASCRTHYFNASQDTLDLLQTQFHGELKELFRSKNR